MRIVKTTTYAYPEHFSETAIVDLPEYSDREDFLDAAFDYCAEILEPDQFHGGQDVGFTFVAVFGGVPRVLEFEFRAEGWEQFLCEFDRFAARVDLAALPSDYRESDLPQIDVMYETEQAHAARLAEEAEEAAEQRRTAEDAAAESALL